MSLFAAIAAGLTTYFVLYKLFFEDLDELVEKLKGFLIWFPISVLLDYVSEKDSLRVWIWLPSGLVVGLWVYVLLK